MKIIIKKVVDKKTDNELITLWSRLEATMPLKLKTVLGVPNYLELPAKNEYVGDITVVGNKLKICLNDSERLVWLFHSQQALEEAEEKINAIRQEELEFLMSIWQERITKIKESELNVQEFVKACTGETIKKPVSRTKVEVEFQVIDLAPTLTKIQTILERIQDLKSFKMERIIITVSIVEQINRALFHSALKELVPKIYKQKLKEAIDHSVFCPLRELEEELRTMVVTLPETEAYILKNEFESFESWLQELLEHLTSNAKASEPQERCTLPEEIEEAKEEL